MLEPPMEKLIVVLRSQVICLNCLARFNHSNAVWACDLANALTDIVEVWVNGVAAKRKTLNSGAMSANP